MKAVQCWDDGVVEDVRLIEILRKYKAQASFNLNAGLHREERYASWRYKDNEVYKLALGELPEVYAGFTVANHTLSHPTLPKIPAADALREITEGRERLEQIMGYEIKGFAYPNGAYSDPVKELIRETGHSYARTTGTAFPLALDDPMAFHPSTHSWRRISGISLSRCARMTALSTSGGTATRSSRRRTGGILSRTSRPCPSTPSGRPCSRFLPDPRIDSLSIHHDTPH